VANGFGSRIEFDLEEKSRNGLEAKRHYFNLGIPIYDDPVIAGWAL
jgi:hypothetical protein